MRKENDMDAKEYLKKALTICKEYDASGRCSDCPLRRLACGAPGEFELIDEVLKVVKRYVKPLPPYVCPKCGFGKHQEDAKFCRGCGEKFYGHETH